MGKPEAMPVLRLLKEPPARRGFVDCPSLKNWWREAASAPAPYRTFRTLRGAQW